MSCNVQSVYQRRMFAADLPEVSNGINAENANATSLKAKSEGLVLKLNYKQLQLYLEGVGFRAIGRIMGVHNVTVLNWVRRMGKSVKSYVQTEMPIDIRHVDFVEMDEMWHFTVKKSENYGYGSLLIGIPKKSLVSRLEVAEKKRLKN